MIDLYTWTTPNGRKISIALEEMGLDYEVKLVDLSKREQFEPSFVEISPNSKVPTIVDHDGPDGQPHSVCESGAILLYLARKTGKFLPTDERSLSVVEQWLFIQTTAIGPMAGQLYHFSKTAPERIGYAIDRYRTEVQRLMGVVETRLSKAEYLAGDYSVADMATFPWVTASKMLLETDLSPYPSTKRWQETIGAREAVQRGMAIPRRN